MERRIVIAKFGECRCRGIDAFVQDDIDVANSFEHSDKASGRSRISPVFRRENDKAIH